MLLRPQRNSRKKIRRSRYSFYKRKFRANPLFKKSSPKRIGLQKKLIVFILFLIGLSGGWFLFFSSTFIISELRIETKNITTKEKTEKIIQDILSEKKWSIISKANFFLFPKSQIEEKLQSEFVLEELVIKRNFPHKLSLAIKEKESTIELFTQTKRFLLDREGRIIREIPQIIEVKDSETSYNIIEEKSGEEGDPILSIAANIPEPQDFFKNRVLMEGENIIIYIMDTSEISSGDQIFSSNNMNHIFEILKVTKNIISVPVIYITYQKRNEGEIRFTTEENWEITFDLKKDISKQLQNLELVYKQKFQEKRGPLQYIDLRFDERVYYK